MPFFPPFSPPPCQLDCRIHVERNNNESDGFVAAVHRFSADRLYVPVAK